LLTSAFSNAARWFEAGIAVFSLTSRMFARILRWKWKNIIHPLIS
jgi:hypothetical protein